MRLATRGSPLALWQARSVAAALGENVELIVVETTGDQRQDVPLDVIGGQGVFVKEVQAAVLDGRADAAVHSAKDLPSTTEPGLVLAAFCRRGDPCDALVGCRLSDLPRGGRVATGSVRRRAQLAHLRPDLEFFDLRGNIATRLRKASEFDAVVMAVAALVRLGLDDRVTDALDAEVMVPQVGQGAIAVECRDGDAAVVSRLAAVDHGATRAAVTAERAFLATLGTGCSLPVGAFCKDGRLSAVIAAPDGSTVLRHVDTGDDPVALGRRVAAHLLAAGGSALLGVV